MRRRGYHSGYHFGALDGGEGREAGPVRPFRARGVLVDEDIARVDRLALRLGVGRRACDLALGRTRLEVPVAIVGTLAGVDGGDHVWGFPPITVGNGTV